MKGLLAAGTILLLSGGAFAQTNPPATGRTGMTDTQIVQQLEKQGYSNVKVTDHDRGHVDVMAMKGPPGGMGQIKSRLGMDMSSTNILLHPNISFDIDTVRRLAGGRIACCH